MLLEPVSIVVPSWNGASILRPTLEHLSRIEGLNYEVLVVDHGRLNRDTETLMKDFSSQPQMKYLGLDEQLGFAGAVNYGTERAKFSLVAVICNDVLVESDWLAELSKAYAEKSVGGRHPVLTALVTRPGFEAALSSRYNIWGRIVDTGNAKSPEEYIPFFPDGSAFLFDKAFYGNPFDKDYFIYQEDVSLGWRAWLLGETVALVPKAKALNADGGTTRRTPYRTAYLTERNRWLNDFKFLSRKVLIRVLPVLLADFFLKLAVGSHRLAKLQALTWILLHPVTIYSKRTSVQKLRKRSDEEILLQLSGRYLSGSSGLNKIFHVYFKIVGLVFGD